MKRALLIQGGWEGHQPQEVAEFLANLLQEEEFVVEISDTLDSLQVEEELLSLDLIVPIWSMGAIAPQQLNPLLNAVRSGVGIAGCHGGMGDAFRNEPEYQFMVGGQWVAHPGNDGVRYEVHMTNPSHPITDGLEDFSVCSEQYYMHVDPAIEVLATTTFRFNGVNRDIEMPVAWTKQYGTGKVFYCSLGHQVNIVSMPEVATLMKRGMVWAAR